MVSDTVTKGYNTVASRYLADRQRLSSGPYIRKMLRLLPRHSSVLDLGCGAGIPIDDMILSAGHSVTGIDISDEMLRRARANCPGADYKTGDIAELAPGQYSVQAIVSFYAFFHVPRGRHGELLKTLSTYLPSNGLLLITFGDRDFQGETEFYGAPMWWSQWGTRKNSELVERAGFVILLDEVARSGGESHHVVMASKK